MGVFVARSNSPTCFGAVFWSALRGPQPSAPCPLSGHRSVWVAKVVGFHADYQLSAHFAPGIFHADFKGYFWSIFDPFLFRSRRCHFLAAGRVYASGRILHLTKCVSKKELIK
jgi:hypothetical protein